MRRCCRLLQSMHAQEDKCWWLAISHLSHFLNIYMAFLH